MNISSLFRLFRLSRREVEVEVPFFEENQPCFVVRIDDETGEPFVSFAWACSYATRNGKTVGLNAARSVNFACVVEFNHFEWVFPTREAAEAACWPLHAAWSEVDDYVYTI